MKCYGVLSSALLIALCCSPVIAQEGSAKGGSDEPDVKAQVRNLEAQLRDAQQALAKAQETLANREKAIAKASEKADKAKAMASQAMEQLGVAQAQMVERQQIVLQRSALTEELVRLRAELARASQKYRGDHPMVIQLRKQVELLETHAVDVAQKAKAQQGQKGRAVKKVQRDDMLAAYKQRLAALKELEAVMKQSTYKQQLERYRTEVEKERADLETRMKLVKKGYAREDQDTQSTRLKQMLEMEQRLKRAEALTRDAPISSMDTGAGPKAAAEQQSKATEQRFDRLEQKLDKIASLLEKMIERDKE